MDDAAPPLVLSAPKNLTDFISRVLAGEPDDLVEAYQYFDAALEQLSQFSEDPEVPVAKLLLEAASLRNQGLYVFSTADFGTAAALLEQLVDRLAQAGVTDAADFWRGLQMVVQANVEIRQQNMGAGLCSQTPFGRNAPTLLLPRFCKVFAGLLSVLQITIRIPSAFSPESAF